MWFVIITAWLVCAGFTSYIASEKNRSAVSWFFVGFVFGIFALIAITAVPSLPSNQRISFDERAHLGSLKAWECGNCHQFNGDAIKICSKCGKERR
jgi:hypothetical protein